MTWLASWQRNPIWNLTFSPDGTFLAAGTGSPGRDAAQVWDLANHRESWSIDSPTAILPVAFSPDGKSLATGHMDGTIEVWDLATRTKRFRFAPQQALLFSLGFSQDGTAIISVAATGAVKSCDATTGEVLATGQADAPNPILERLRPGLTTPPPTVVNPHPVAPAPAGNPAVQVTV